MDSVLSSKQIRSIVERAANRLSGDWVLLGGALAALWFSAARVTEDIDLIPMGADRDGRHELMEFALEEGLPLEAVNSAADFFLRRIAGWAGELELLHTGSRARIFRPTPTLFLLLKSGRMSEADLEDCVQLIDFAQRHALAVDRGRVREHVLSLPEPESSGSKTRRDCLLRALGTSE